MGNETDRERGEYPGHGSNLRLVERVGASGIGIRCSLVGEQTGDAVYRNEGAHHAEH